MLGFCALLCVTIYRRFAFGFRVWLEEVGGWMPGTGDWRLETGWVSGGGGMMDEVNEGETNKVLISARFPGWGLPDGVCVVVL